MMKRITALLALAAMAVFANVEKPFVQFTRSDFANEMRPADKDASQGTTGAGDWYTSQLISLKITGGSDVYLSHKVENWFGEMPVLDGQDWPNKYDMTSAPERYGYIYKADFAGDLTKEKGTYDDLIHWAKGTVTDVTYYDETWTHSRTTEAYLLDHFADDTEIYLVLTTMAADGNETVDSYQYVSSDNHAETSLVSRTYDYNDLAGNVVINFGVMSETYGRAGREFVAVYNRGETIPGGGGTTGGPLPCGAIAWLISAVTVAAASRKKLI